ncbi:hypothetical protein [Serinicoccus sp. LYQ131]|uniref:hypothetical protein n=1 Tax=Serinicoccus sp. LYQ131 TaxID=3378797 RepID=UPI003854B815
MHVVVVAHARHPLAEPFAGGLESLTAHLVSGLATRGHRVSVFAARVQDEAGRPLREAELVRSGAELLGEVLQLARPLARAHALQHHSVDAMVDRFERVYESAARLRSRSLHQPREAGPIAERAGRRERAARERTAHPRTVGSRALSGAEAEPGR